MIMKRLLKLGVPVKDKASGLSGQLTHVQTDGKVEFYLFQPKGLNPETGSPVDAHWLTADRIKDGQLTHVTLPLEMIGTYATDTASGFRGIVTYLELHINGCVHAILQPKGTVKKTGNMIKQENFDIRRLKGVKVPKIKSEKELRKSLKKHPSPAPRHDFVPVGGN